tara:strand:+ start:40 stop:1368 length:1329 start_codon:yes stop_codon:yes gene_type:complete
MKIFNTILLFLFLNSCSFDNKSGIWDGNELRKKAKKEEEFLIDAKDIFTTESDQLKEFDSGINLVSAISPAKTPKKWTEENFNNLNNPDNSVYLNQKKLAYKSKKISGHQISNNFLYDDNKFIFSDLKGNIIVLSEKDQTVKFKFNFYKNILKNFPKKINLILKNNVVFAADNLGYVYALDAKTEKIVWAKNYGVPFFSNIKIIDDLIFLVNKDNKVYILNLFSGEKIWEYSTDKSTLNTKYKNIISYSGNNLILLNTNGSVYAIDILNKNIKWFYNVNSIVASKNDIFNGISNIIDNRSVLIVGSNSISALDLENGNLIWQKKYNIEVDPLVSSELILILTKENYLTFLSKETGEVIWSSKLSNMRKIYSDKKFKNKNISSMKLMNNNLFLFSEGSELIEVSLQDKKIKNIFNSKYGFRSEIIVINNHLYFVDKKKLIKLS